MKGCDLMKALKILSLLIISFWLLSSFAVTINRKNKKEIAVTFVVFLLTIIPLVYIYIR